jgi:hypothetical protein
VLETQATLATLATLATHTVKRFPFSYQHDHLSLQQQEQQQQIQSPNQNLKNDDEINNNNNNNNNCLLLDSIGVRTTVCLDTRCGILSALPVDEIALDAQKHVVSSTEDRRRTAISSQPCQHNDDDGGPFDVFFVFG